MIPSLILGDISTANIEMQQRPHFLLTINVSAWSAVRRQGGRCHARVCQYVGLNLEAHRSVIKADAPVEALQTRLAGVSTELAIGPAQEIKLKRSNPFFIGTWALVISFINVGSLTAFLRIHVLWYTSLGVRRRFYGLFEGVDCNSSIVVAIKNTIVSCHGPRASRLDDRI